MSTPVRSKRAPATSIIETAVRRNSAGAAANELLTFSPIPAIRRAELLCGDSSRMPLTFLPDKKTSLGHFKPTTACGNDCWITSQTARPVASATCGKLSIGSPTRRGSSTTENVSAPGPDHQTLLPRPRPAVCRAARIRQGQGSAASAARSAARSLVEPISECTSSSPTSPAERIRSTSADVNSADVQSNGHLRGKESGRWPPGQAVPAVFMASGPIRGSTAANATR